MLQDVEIQEDRQQIQENKQIIRGVSNQLGTIMEQIKNERKISKQLNIIQEPISKEPV